MNTAVVGLKQFSAASRSGGALLRTGARRFPPRQGLSRVSWRCADDMLQAVLAGRCCAQERGDSRLVKACRECRGIVRTTQMALD